MHVMTEEYINPFDESLAKDCLYNLSSGIEVGLEIANEISQIKAKGMHNTMNLSRKGSSLLMSQFMTLSSAINFYCSKMPARK